MSGSNLTGLNPAIKAVRTCMLLSVVALLVSCSDDSSTNATGEIDYNGTWVAAYASEIVDAETQYTYNSTSISGIMLIRDTLYSLVVRFQVGSNNFFSRSDAGRLFINDGYVDFEMVTDTSLQSIPRGHYDSNKNQLTISYLGNNALWTEIWKRAQPVAASDTSFNYVPY